MIFVFEGWGYAEDWIRDSEYGSKSLRKVNKGTIEKSNLKLVLCNPPLLLLTSSHIKLQSIMTDVSTMKSRPMKVGKQNESMYSVQSEKPYLSRQEYENLLIKIT